MTIENIYTKDLITMKKDSSIKDVAMMMKKYDIGFIPITDDKKIVGVITDRDITTRCISNASDLNTPIESYITEKVLSVKYNDDIKTVLKIMSEKKVKRLLITNKKKVIGVISISDIINDIDSNTLKETLSKIWEINRNISIFKTEIDEFYL